MSIKKYRIKCLTDNKNEDVIANSPPTVCPVNAAHSVDSNGVGCLEKDVKVNDGTLKDLTFADYKQLRYTELDAQTDVLLLSGFTYDTKQFSLSLNAQTNWTGLKTNTSDFTWPVEVSTLTEGENYNLANADVVAFWNAGKDRLQAVLDGGRAKKAAILAAVDEAAVDAIIDDRT
jgi:hypothetical protein